MNPGEVQTRTSDIHTLLRALTTSTYTELPSPEGAKRRASVALVIRIKPSHTHWPTWPTSASKSPDLETFFAQEWVQHGDPEVLFIKRASRKGDRWTSHIALPGGKRDANDKNDQAAAIRESLEEVGLDILEYGIECGNLPQRLVTTHWGKRPLLVLCPYVFLLTTHQIPPLKLQPSEVAAIHWVPIRRLQDPKSRTVAFEDVSSRLANQETGVKKWMLGLILGKMVFAAISLLPTESLHASDDAPTQQTQQLQDNRLAPQTLHSRLRALATRISRTDIFNQYLPPHPPEAPLLLWGLTLGVLSDFLDLLPPHNALTLWTYPNFTPLDVRFAVWLLTYRFKERKRAELQSGSEFLTDHPNANPTFGYASESVAAHSSYSAVIDSSTVLVSRPDETGFHGLGTGVSVPEHSEGSDNKGKGKKAAVATMLQGFVDALAEYVLPEITNRARYYDLVRRAVAVALVGRASLVVVLAVVAWKRWRGRWLG